MNDASAHIDPGTSSMLLQVIVGALVVGITIKVYWGKINLELSVEQKNN
tara:strand:+ start:238 stop:384 length:147 start_codon:yes stop_codon:yes gene_type:complete